MSVRWSRVDRIVRQPRVCGAVRPRKIEFGVASQRQSRAPRCLTRRIRPSRPVEPSWRPAAGRPGSQRRDQVRPAQPGPVRLSLGPGSASFLQSCSTALVFCSLYCLHVAIVFYRNTVPELPATIYCGSPQSLSTASLFATATLKSVAKKLLPFEPPDSPAAC